MIIKIRPSPGIERELNLSFKTMFSKMLAQIQSDSIKYINRQVHFQCRAQTNKMGTPTFDQALNIITRQFDDYRLWPIGYNNGSCFQP